MFDNDKEGCLAAVGLLIGAIALCAVLFLLEAWIGMLLWNALIPVVVTADILNPEIGFWQMYGLIWLVHIIFPNPTTKWSSKD